MMPALGANMRVWKACPGCAVSPAEHVDAPRAHRTPNAFFHAALLTAQRPTAARSRNGTKRIGRASRPARRPHAVEADVRYRDAERRRDVASAAGAPMSSRAGAASRTPRGRRRADGVTWQRHRPDAEFEHEVARLRAAVDRPSSTAVPTVGWPAKGNSLTGVKMRSFARCALSPAAARTRFRTD